MTESADGEAAHGSSQGESVGSARSEAWRRSSDAERRALLVATRAAVGSAAAELSSAYARTRRAEVAPDALADGFLLGPAPLAALLRALEGATRGADALVERRGVIRAKRGWLDRIARPRVSIRFERRATEEPADAAPAERVIYADADAISIALGCATRELFLRDRASTVIVATGWVEAAQKALAPLVSAGHVRIEGGDVETSIAAAGGASSVLAIAPPGARAALRDASARAVEGCSLSPSLVAIVPFLYGKDELGVLASHVASELQAPPGPTRGVALILGRHWLQTEVFLERLGAELARRTPRVGAPRTSDRGAWLVTEETEIAGERPVLRMFERGSDDPTRFVSSLGATLREVATSEPGAPRAPLVSVFTHPMLHERPTFVRALDAFAAECNASALGIGTRASLAWSMGGLVLAPTLRHYASWMLQYPHRVTIEAPLRLSVPAGLRELERRASFEATPSIGKALSLGARSLLLNAP